MFGEIKKPNFSFSLLIGVSSFVLVAITSLFITSDIKWLLFPMSFIGWTYFSLAVFKQIIHTNKLSNKVLQPIFPFLLVLLMSIWSAFSTTNYPPFREKMFPFLIAIVICFLIFSGFFLIAFIKIKASTLNTKESTNRSGKPINYLLKIISTIVIVSTLLFLYFGKNGIGEVFYIFAMTGASFLMFINYNKRIKEKDELKRQIDAEVYTKTYSLLLPIFFLIGFVILRISGAQEKATIVVLIFVVIILVENSVRYFVKKKYDYEEE